MSPYKIPLFAIAPLFAIGFVTMLGSQARAEDAATAPAATPPAAEAPAADGGKHHGGGGGRMFMDEAEMNKVDAMNDDDREAYFKQKHDEWSKLSPAEKDAKKAEMKAKFEALPPEQQEAMKAKMKERMEARKAKMKEKWEKMTPEEKKARIEKNKEWFNNLPAEEQEKMKSHFEGKRGHGDGAAEGKGKGGFMKHLRDKKSGATPVEGPSDQ